MALPTPRPTFHVSKNRLDGSLCDTPLEKLLDSCRDHLITGTIRITTQFTDGSIELRAGMIDSARLGDDLEGEPAVRRMKRLGEGMYELTQRLPDLDGILGDAATCEGDLSTTKLVSIMRLCEDQALSCTITIVSAFDRGEIIYKAGEIKGVTFNGHRDDDAIVDITSFRTGRFRIEAPALPDDIDGWPATSKDPTLPFRLHHMAPPPRAPSQQPVLASVPRLPGLTSAPAEPIADLTPPVIVDDSALRASTARALARHLSSPVPELPPAAEPLGDDDEFERNRAIGWQIAAFGLLAVVFVAAWVALVIYAT
jgi:hypothetical protein